MRLQEAPRQCLLRDMFVHSSEGSAGTRNVMKFREAGQNVTGGAESALLAPSAHECACDFPRTGSAGSLSAQRHRPGCAAGRGKQKRSHTVTLARTLACVTRLRRAKGSLAIDRIPTPACAGAPWDLGCAWLGPSRHGWPSALRRNAPRRQPSPTSRRVASWLPR